jgi:hypothetical protein
MLGRQLDFDPPETTEEYRAFIEDCTAKPSSENWRLPFMGEKWVAMNAGEFAIRHFL